MMKGRSVSESCKRGQIFKQKLPLTLTKITFCGCFQEALEIGKVPSFGLSSFNFSKIHRWLCDGKISLSNLIENGGSSRSGLTNTMFHHFLCKQNNLPLLMNKSKLWMPGCHGQTVADMERATGKGEKRYEKNFTKFLRAKGTQSVGPPPNFNWMLRTASRHIQGSSIWRAPGLVNF